MIYIPEKYIFIVGGPNETNVELYDIDKNITTIDSQLNTERCEPSLILVNNKYLYSIFGFHLYESFIDTIERCNLHRKHRNWDRLICDKRMPSGMWRVTAGLCHGKKSETVDARITMFL